MLTATSWPSKPAAGPYRRALGILLGYNLFFVIWTTYAMWLAWGSHAPGWTCPVRHFIGWCPGCGLTRAYASMLRGEGISSWWFALVFFGFVANAGWSLVKVRRVLR